MPETSGNFGEALEQANQSLVTQTPFFTKEFNTAIIDGPLRIYFSDLHEALALQLYFDIQEAMDQVGKRLHELSPKTSYLYLMLYPKIESFPEVFHGEKTQSPWAVGDIDGNEVLGINIENLESPTANLPHQICQHVQSTFVSN